LTGAICSRVRSSAGRGNSIGDTPTQALDRDAIGSNRYRHCERKGVERRPSFRTGYGEAIQESSGALRRLDRRVASLPAMTMPHELKASRGEQWPLV
jgi:hypothetical protein